MTNTSDQSIDLGHMIEGIRRWVETESPSNNKAAVNRMIDLIVADLDGLPVRIERIGGHQGYADMLKVRVGAGEAPGILVLSHIDTVHPIGTLTGVLPFRRDGDRLYGPGLYDMKGGAYIAFDALRNVARAGTARLPIVHLFTPDEEVGSPISREEIEAEARRARYVLVTAAGIPAHSGGAHRKGRSAIREMAHQILAIEGMTDYGRGVTTTVGMI